MKRTINILTSIILILFVFTGVTISQNKDEIRERAERYLKEKKFNKAIEEWLTLLDIDPENEEAKRNIESVYDIKFTKDISMQKAQMQFRMARRTLSTDIDKSSDNAEKAMDNFVTAYRIDPTDPEMQVLREGLEKFMEDLKIEKAKKRLSQEMQTKYYELLETAREKMKLKQYEEALDVWDEILDFVPLDSAANEGRRQATLAIENRLKFERVMALLDSGTALFKEKKYKESRLEFQQALSIDPANESAKSYIIEIDDLLEEAASYELRMMQAEQLYRSGIENLKSNNFNGAQDDFENVLAVMENYKDTAARLKSIESLRKDYLERERMLKLKKIDNDFQAGLVALSEGKYRIAINSFENILAVDTSNSLATRYMQTAKDALKQQREERVDEDSPYYDIVHSLTVSGEILFRKGEYNESMRNWEKILNLFPKNKIATEYLLKCNLRMNPAAFDEFSKKIVDEGRGLLKEKQFKDAMSKFEIIKSISPDYPGINGLIESARKGMTVKTVVTGVSAGEIERRNKLGIEYYRKGGKENLEKALREFEWISSNDPENTSALIYVNKIGSQLRVGVAEEPEAAQKLTPKQRLYVKSHYMNGINYYFNNNFSEAISEWRKVLVVDPNHEEAKMNIRKCLVLLKR